MNAPIHKELPAHLLNAETALRDVTQAWDSRILKELTSYIEVPAKSPSFDSNWEANGYLDTVLRQTAEWVEAQKVAGLSLEILRLPGRTPVLFFDIPATRAASEGSGQTVLMYGHLDNNLNSVAGAMTWVLGHPNMKTANSMVVVVPMTAMPPMPALPQFRL